MTNSRHDEEMLLIDLLLGRCDAEQQQALRRRLDGDESLRRRHDDLQRTFAALELLPDYEPPEDLVEGTLRRIRSARETDALLAREELGRRDVIRPTFSLRELAAIAGVVILLAGIFGLSYRQAHRQRMIKQCFAQQGRIGAALLTYANNNEGFLPSAGGSNRNWLPTSRRAVASNSTALYRLVRSGYESPVTFQCPAVGGGSFTARAEMVDFPAGRYVHYSYQYSLGPVGLSIDDKGLAVVKKRMAILADNTPMFYKGRFRRDRVRADNSDNHDGLGQNVLYLDMHVEFNDRASVGVHGDNIYLIKGVFEYRGDEAPNSPYDSFLLPAFSTANIRDY